MKKIITLFAIVLMPFSSAVAEGAFDGVNLQIGLGAAIVKSEENRIFNNATSGASTIDVSNFNKTNLIGNVTLGYSKKINSDFNMAGNVFYNFGSTNFGSQTSGAGASALTVTSKVKDVGGITLEPGYYFTQQILGYLKFGAAQGNLSTTSSYSGLPSENSNYGNSIGFLWGLGGKYALDKNLFMGAEFYQINFAKKTTTQAPYTEGGSGDVIYPSNTFQPTYNYFGLFAGYRFN
jgi:opacity protein-like surface antigen